MNTRSFSFMASAALAIAPVPAAAAADQATVPVAATQAVSLPTMGAVTAFYNRWKTQPLWFQGNVPTAAANQLPNLLRRSAFEGLGSGPEMALQVEAAIRQAASGNPAAVQQAERTLSAAWVLYVQTIRRPTPGMAYAYDTLKPQGTSADQILLAATSVPNFAQHMLKVSNVNPIYQSIRDAAWNEAQATGNFNPDPRVLANLARVRSLPDSGRWVLVDAGSQRLTMFENGQPVDSMKVIVGEDKPELRTPLLASYMYYVTLNPYWNAPDHLARNIAKVYLKQGKGYLNWRGYEVMSDWTTEASAIAPEKVDWKGIANGTKEVRIRQKPGEHNFMGTMKFPFANPNDIYLHDTPTRELFDKSTRTLSNGCVRLEDAERFGRWLLGREPSTTSKEAEQHVQLARGVPIYVTYITAQAKDGKLTYLKDVYGWDQPGAMQQLASRQTP